jgi:hypothetical protein
MGSTTLSIQKGADLGPAVAKAQPVERSVTVDGVRAPAGPSFERIEQMIGKRLPRVKMADLLPVVTQEAASPKTQETAKPFADRASLEAARRAGEQAARETKGFQSRGGSAPTRVSVVRPIGFGRIGKRPGAALEDTSGVEPGGRR